jgi:hypothetical protein
VPLARRSEAGTRIERGPDIPTAIAALRVLDERDHVGLGVAIDIADSALLRARAEVVMPLARRSEAGTRIERDPDIPTTVAALGIFDKDHQITPPITVEIGHLALFRADAEVVVPLGCRAKARPGAEGDEDIPEAGSGLGAFHEGYEVCAPIGVQVGDGALFGADAEVVVTLERGPEAGAVVDADEDVARVRAGARALDERDKVASAIAVDIGDLAMLTGQAERVMPLRARSMAVDGAPRP